MDQDHLIERKVSELIANTSESQLKCLLVENGLANVPLTAHTKSSLLKQLARKLLNLTSSPEAVAAVTVTEPHTDISLDASSAMTATEQHKNTPPETLDSLTVGAAAVTEQHKNTPPETLDSLTFDAAAVAEQHKQISSEEAKVESNNNTDSIRKTLEEAKESLSFCLNEDNKTHYAVCIPGQDDSITVHTDFREVLKLMKENKAQNPRMLSFRNKAEAETFAEQHTANEVCEGSTIKSSYPEERAEVEQGEVKLFPSLTTPQLSEFRIQLEKGNVSFCRERILSNPRFLIGNGDMPTILKEGPRYNAMHASVIAGQLESCQLIMEMVSDVEFLKRMYVTQARAEENSQRLTDLYLNTPDKIANKTPLHFASEKGMVDIVAFLVTFQACIRNFNRHMLVSMKKGDKQFESRVCTGKTPEEVACSRYNGPNPATVKAKIINLIQEGVCYVPLIKSDTIGPCVKVGDPYSPTSPYKLVSEIEDVFRPATDAEASLKDIRNMKVWAFAGPMSPHEGREFKRAWKSPRTKRANLKESLKVTDGDRGFEHFGRELADNHATSWQEFWPFLNEFADLRSEAGLDKLETFFQKHSVIVNMQTFLRPLAQFVDAEPYRVGVEYILKPVPEPSVSLESENFVSVDSNVAESVSEQSQQTEEVSQVPQVSSVKDVVESENKSSPGFLSSLWGGLAKIKVYLSQSASKGSSQCSEVSQPKLLELDNVNPVQPLHDTGSPPLVSAEQGDSNDDKAKEDHDLSQEVPSSVLEKESKISLCETNIPVKQSMDEHVAQEELADDTPVRSSYSVENDSGIPEVFTVRSHMDNSLTPRHWKYRSSRYSLDSPEKERDSESPSRKSSSGRKYYSDSERDRESPSRRVSRLTKHYSDYHPDQRRPSPSKKESKSSSSFNAKMESLCRHLDKFSIVSPEKSTSSLLSVSYDLTSLKSLILEPSLKIFMGKMFTQFAAYLNTVNKTTSNKAAPQDLPIACLKQDNETILADIFLPQAIPDSTWLTSVLDEQTHHEIVKNVWVNYLVLFPDSDNAQKVCSLSTDDVFNVVVEGLPEDNKLNSKSIKELYKQSCESIEDKLSLTLEMRVIRIDTIPKKDIFVCGSVPTKVDADIYNTLNAQSCQLIRGQSQRFSSCRQWLDRMDKPGREFICSLPSPARVLRLERRELFPVSPLVLNDTRLPPQMTSTPKSSRTPHIS